MTQQSIWDAMMDHRDQSLSSRANIYRVWPILRYIGGGLLLLLSSFIVLGDAGQWRVFPITPGYEHTDAYVYGKMRRGTVMEPRYSLVLTYGDRMEWEVRRPVEAEEYFTVKIGDKVTIAYPHDNPSEWSLVQDQRDPRLLTLGIALGIIGAAMVLLPQILRLALRQDDFGY